MKQKQLVTISRNELKNVLMNIDIPTFISMRTETPVDMNQYLDYWLVTDGKRTKNPNPTRNPFFDNGIVNKSYKYKIITGFDYEKSVNGRREREGKETDFEQKENWMKFLSKGLVTDKKTESKFYLRYQFLEDSSIDTEYLYNNDPIFKGQFEQYLKSHTDYSGQGLDNPLMFQVCNLENITEITISGVRYTLID